MFTAADATARAQPIQTQKQWGKFPLPGRPCRVGQTFFVPRHLQHQPLGKVFCIYNQFAATIQMLIDWLAQRVVESIGLGKKLPLGTKLVLNQVMNDAAEITQRKRIAIIELPKILGNTTGKTHHPLSRNKENARCPVFGFAGLGQIRQRHFFSIPLQGRIIPPGRCHTLAKIATQKT